MRNPVSPSSLFVFSLFVFFLFVFFLPPWLMAQSQPSASARPSRETEAVEHVLQVQQDAWNRHDLASFMTGYWNSPDLTFFSSAKENDSWQATMDRYRATYQSAGHEMGKLEFSGIRIEMLGTEAAFVRGRWQLTTSDGNNPHGLFTLIFRKFPEGWKIVHDHTSAAE